ncbi:MAG: metalloregulator ArsR/SmtB family transcription factor [Vicinamibacterales bacterium]
MSARVKPRRAADLDPVWRALASPIRRHMLDLLHERPRTTGDLAAQFPGLSRFAVMQHLRVLEAGRLTIYRRQGRERINSMNPVPIQQIFDRWVKRYHQPWLETLVALKHQLEAEPAKKQRA